MAAAKLSPLPLRSTRGGGGGATIKKSTSIIPTRKREHNSPQHSPAGARAGLGVEEAGEACLLVKGAGEERHGCDRGVWF